MWKDLIFGGAGYGLAIVAGFMYVDAKEDLASEIERCNTAQVAAVAAAERTVREYERRVADERAAQLQRRFELEREARETAEKVARAALARPQLVREVIRESDDNCLDEPVPLGILDELRED